MTRVKRAGTGLGDELLHEGTQLFRLGFRGLDRAVLDELKVHTYHHVITLGYSDKLGPQEADAITLITLLHLRALAEKQSQRFSIVSEMLDARNRELAEVARADDFIVGDKLVSQLLAQMSENPVLMLDDLFDVHARCACG